MSLRKNNKKKSEEEKIPEYIEEDDFERTFSFYSDFGC